jgi:hypothetical protein
MHLLFWVLDFVHLLLSSKNIDFVPILLIDRSSELVEQLAMFPDPPAEELSPHVKKPHANCAAAPENTQSA